MAVISLRAAPGLDSLRTRTDHLERLQVHLADKTPVTKSNLASLPPRELDRVRTSLATRDRSEYYLGNGKDDPIQATSEADDLFVHGPVWSPLLGEEIHQRQRRRVEQG